MKREDFLMFGKPKISEESIKDVASVLRSGWIGEGKRVVEFENAFKESIGSKYAVTVNSCTSALTLCLKVNDIRKGDEVITTPMTFCATANVVLHQNTKPVFTDIQKDTFNIDPDEINEKITGKTKAIIPVHLAGHPCDMDEIKKVAEDNNLILIEDAAHALGAEYKGNKIGSSDNFACFSFYPNKNITTIEGGMITFNQEGFIEKLQRLRSHGLDKEAWKRFQEKEFKHYRVVEAGYKYNMTDVQAALGINQLKEFEENYKIRERLWKKYNELLRNIDGIRLPVVKDYVKHSFYLYIILVDPGVIERDKLAAGLLKENIGVGIHYNALHLEPLYSKLGYKRGDFPKAEFVSDRTLSLPLSATMNEKDIEDVAEAIKRILD